MQETPKNPAPPPAFALADGDDDRNRPSPTLLIQTRPAGSMGPACRKVGRIQAALVLAAAALPFQHGCGGVRSADQAPETPAANAAATRAGDPDANAPVAGSPAHARRLVLTGELRAVNNVEVKTPESDRFPIQIRWMAPEGTMVREGDEILQFDSTAIQTKLEEERLAHIEASIKLRSRESSLSVERADKQFAVEKAQIELEKAKVEASVPAEMRPRREYDEKQIALERALSTVESARRDLAAFEVSARAELDVLRLAVNKAERNIVQARSYLESYSARASRAGVLVYGEHPWQNNRKFVPGDDVFPGFTIVKIPDLSAMEVQAWLSDVDDGAMEPGQEVTCTLDSYPERAFPCHVASVHALAEDRYPPAGIVRAFRVLVKLDESDPALMRPGMSVKVELARTTS
jgi:multidrug efflux pump subunit AcrA (membrane-fusion protein)